MSGEFQFETAVGYEAAGVQFNVGLKTPPGGGKAAFSVTVDNAATGQRLDFSHKACPAVHDFTRGYSRWLAARGGIDANLGADEITGPAQGDFSTAELLQVAHGAVDMIDQKFTNYRGPIIGSDDYSDIVYEKKDGVAWLLINRPETYNAKRGITMDQMANAMLDASKDNSIRVLVVHGAGPNGFCTGNDQSYDPDVESADYAGTAQVTYEEVMRRMPQPVIAAVDGYAIGSGNILAYTADYTIATTRSRFGQTGPRVGSPAAGHGVAMLAARVGQKRAREIWMVCQQYPAQEAYEMGLVNKVVEPDQLWEEVDRWIGLIKNVSPVILQMQKISYNQHDDFILPEKGPVEKYIPDYLASEECKERRNAFLERRPIDSSKNMPYVQIPIK
ncbi:MAG: enoyl-CoA hydratase-related protein [Dehalococcoidia bacterium]